MASLHLIQGPAGSGKSQVARDLLEAGEVQAVADTTSLWAALAQARRGPDGRYPVRADDDPALGLALYVQATAVRQGLRQGLDVAATTSQRDQVGRWREILEDEAPGGELHVRTVDPGEDVIRARLAEQGGALSPECEAAIGRWFG